jgi:hypothetical protein
VRSLKSIVLGWQAQRSDLHGRGSISCEMMSFYRVLNLPLTVLTIYCYRSHSGSVARESAWPDRQTEVSRIVSEQNANPVLPVRKAVLAKSPYSGRKITASFGNDIVRGEKMQRARGKHDGQQSEHV